MRNDFNLGKFLEELENANTLTKIKMLVCTTPGKIATILVGGTMMIVTPAATLKRVKVPSGHEAVKISKPLFFGNGGVQADVIKTGATWTWRTNDIVEINLRPTQYEEKFDDIMTADNVPVDFTAFIKIKIQDTKGPLLIEKFGDEWYKNNLKQIIRTELRDAIAKYPMTTLTTRQEVLNTIQKQVFNEIEKFIKQARLPVDLQEVILGQMNPPDQIKNQLAETAAQQQRKKTEAEKAGAEIERKNAETRRAEADNAYRNALGLSPDQFVQLETLKTQKETARILADSKGNITVIIGQNGGVQPIMNVGKK